MERKLSFYLAILLLIGLTIVGCNGQEGPSSTTPSTTPAPISILATHSQSPDIRGEITAILETEGQINAVHIKGILEEDTKYDQATARITEETHVYVLRGDNYELASTNQLSVSQTIEVLFTGVILEKYPVSAEASEILIIP